MQKALIYCRVSSERQKIEGHGLESQEQRCKEYAQRKGYEVEKVFHDSWSGGGDYTKRPAMSEMLVHVDSKPYNSYVIIFDDLKRLARDTEQYLLLKKSLDLRGVGVECPNFVFDESPEGKWLTTIMMANGQLEREQNRRQVLQKMKARLELGCYPFPGLPQGYKHSKTTLNGNSTPVFDEPKASIVREGLEGFASGRFPEQIDLQNFFKEKKLKGNMPIYLEQVKRILVNSIFYAGYIEYKPWEVSLRKGQHEGLISLATHERIQERMNGTRTFIRRTLNPNFPLRKFVLCGKCRKPLTASQTKGRNCLKSYYWCNAKDCSERYKSIRKDDIHAEFEVILSKIKPSEKVLNLSKAIAKDLWEKKEGEIVAKRKRISGELESLGAERKRLFSLLVRATDERMTTLYEERISEIAERELVLKESLMSFDQYKPNIEIALDIVFDFLKNPLVQWRKGDINTKKLLLNLVFEENLAYNKNNGFETAILSLPLRVFTLPKASETCLVEVGRMSSRP